MAEDAGEDGEGASIGNQREEAKEFPLKSRGWGFPHTCPQISGLLSIFKLASREVQPSSV